MYFATILRDAQTRKPSGTQKVPSVIYLIGATSMLTDVAAEMVASVLPLYLFTVLMLSPLQVGFLDGLYQGGASVLRIFAGYAADRLQSNKWVAFVGYLFSTIARIGLLLSTSVGLILAASSLFLDRVGKAIRTAPRDALIAGHTVASLHGAAFGLHRSMDAFGALLGPLIAAGLLWWRPQRFDILIGVSLVIGLIGLILFALYVHEPAAFPSSSAQGGSTPTEHSDAFPIEPTTIPTLTLWSALRQLRSNSDFMRLTLFACVLSLFTISDGLIYLAMQKRLGFASQTVPLLFVATAVVFMIASPWVGRLGQASGFVRMLLVGYGALFVTYAIFALHLVPGWFGVALMIACFGFHYAATDGILAILAVQRLPLSIRTTGLALLTTCVALTKIASSTLYGWVWQTTNETLATGVFTGGILVCLGLAIGMLRNEDRKYQNVDGV